MQKKYFFIPIIASLAIYSHLTSDVYNLVHAAAPSPSPASIDEVTNNLKERLQNSLLGLDNKTASPSASSYVGSVTDVVSNTVVVTDKDGKKDVKLSDDTVILRTPGNVAIKPTDVRIDDSIIALGYMDKDNVLSGKRLIVSTTPLESLAKTSALGVIKTITKSALTLTIDDQVLPVSLTNQTLYKSPVGTLDFTSLSAGDTIVYTADLDAQNHQTATIVMRILSTSTATPSPAPSGARQSEVGPSPAPKK